MIYCKGDKVRIRKNYRLRNNSYAFAEIYEQKIQKLENRAATIIRCTKSCSYDRHEPGYSFREFPRLVFKESMIDCLVDGQGINSRFDILDL